MIENIQISTNNTLNALDKKYYSSDKAGYSFAWVAIVLISLMCSLFFFNDCYKLLCLIMEKKNFYDFTRDGIKIDHNKVVCQSFELKKRNQIELEIKKKMKIFLKNSKNSKI
jgi:hypothetical protein